MILFQTPPSKIELGGAGDLAFAVAAPLPALGAKDLAILRADLEALPKGSAIYSTRTIRQITDGRTIHCRLLPDSVVISFEAAPGQASAGTDLLASLIREPNLSQEDLGACLAREKVRESDFWSCSMDPSYPTPPAFDHAKAMEVFQRVFRPDRITMIYSGSTGSTDVGKEWAARVAGWEPKKPPLFPDDSKLVENTSDSTGVTTAVLRSPTFAANDPSFSARLLALYALGSGKGSSLFRISRARHAWTYRQESYLWPSSKGWEPRLFLAMAPTPEAEQRVVEVRAEVAEDVKAWSEDDRVRALGMAEATLLRGLPYGPIVLGDRPLSEAPEDQVAFAAYWRSKTGSDWDAQGLYAKLAGVSLEALRSAAKGIIEGASVRVLAAGGPQR